MNGLPTPRRRDTSDTVPTTARTIVDDGHFPPASGLDHAGRPWRGASRIIDRPARRRAQRLSWRKLKAEARRAYLAALRDGAS